MRRKVFCDVVRRSGLWIRGFTAQLVSVQTLAALAKFQAKLKEVQEREPASPEKEGEEEEEGSDRW